MEPSKSNSDPLPGGAGTEYTVFLSYSRADQKLAIPVIEMLENAGFSVWWDGLLEGGERFARTTEAVLENAKAVVVLWSETSIDSHWVHDEATRGRDRRCLVPLSIDGSEPPLGFRQFQVIDVSGAKARTDAPEMRKALHAVATLHGDESFSAKNSAASVSRSSPSVDRRTLLLGGAAAAVAGGGFVIWNSDILGGGPVQNSAAVLPFTNVSGDPEQSYFSDGLTAEIRSELSRNELLQIVGQSSSNNFRESNEDAKAISKKLGVAYLLGGTVRKAGDTLRITAELTDGSTGFSEWTETFDRSLSNVFEVQQEIAAAVRTALSVQIQDGVSGSKADQIGGTDSVTAFDAYLRGKDLFELAIDESSDRQSLAKFDEAIAIDARYAAAHAARSRTLAVLANQYAQGTERSSLYDNAVEAARLAVKIEPNLAAAQSSLGYALFYGRLDVRGAREPYEKSYLLGKGDPDVLGRFALYGGRTGRFREANAAIEQAIKLDPLNPITLKSSGSIKLAAKQYEAAVIAGEAALALNPQMGGVHADIGNALLMLGKIDEARQSFEDEKNSLVSLPGLAIIANQQGNETEASRLFDELVAEHGDNGLYQQAQVLAQSGDTGAALQALERARATGDGGLTFVRHDPLLQPLANEEEYQKLVLSMGFV